MIQHREGNRESGILRGRPEKLYRYRPLSSEAEWGFLERIIVDSKMFAASRLILNDPADCTVRIAWDASLEEFQARYWESYKKDHAKLSESELREHFGRWHRSVTTAGSMDQATVNMQVSADSYGVICFSPAPDMANQWEDYATSSQGVCLVFDVNAESQLREKLVRVEYVDELPVAHAFRDSSDLQVAKCLYTKTSKWSGEQEWRAIFPGLANTEVSFAPDALTEIVLGSEMSADAEGRVRRMAQERGRPLRISRHSRGAGNRRES